MEQLIYVNTHVDEIISRPSLDMTSRDFSFIEGIIVTGRRGRSCGPVARVLISKCSLGALVRLSIVMNCTLSEFATGGEEQNRIIIYLLINIKGHRRAAWLHLVLF